MGAVLRIVARYVIGYAVAKGLLPQELVDQITNSPEAAAWLDAILIGVAVAAVEGARKLAVKRGWSL